jgi:hypothetical protein
MMKVLAMKVVASMTFGGFDREQRADANAYASRAVAHLPASRAAV